MEVLSIIKHSLASDGANPITGHFRLIKQVSCAGQEMVWRIFDAVRIKDGKEASVFIFEKKIADKLHKPKRRELVTDLLRRDVINMSRLRHQSILKVIHTLEECNDSLAFATERVLSSLANLLGICDRLPLTSLNELKEHNFMEIDIKYGILQLAEALHFLHSTERVLHLNVSPQNIVVTKKGAWKLIGLGFLQSIDANPKDPGSVRSWSQKASKMARPDADYAAPELHLETAAAGAGAAGAGAARAPLTPACDVFSLGMVICAVHNAGKSLLQGANNASNYSRQMEKVSELFGEVAGRIPGPLVETVERMIQRDVRYRPSTQSFIMLKYFDDPVVHCMNSLDAIESKELSQKCEYFTVLTRSIPLFPKKLLYGSVLLMVREQLENAEHLVLVLPSVVSLIENASDEEFRSILQPELKRIINMTKPVQATVYLLERLDVLLAKSAEDEVYNDILPMIFGILESNSLQGQEAALNVFGIIKQYLDDQTMTKLFLPKAKALFVKATSVRTRLNALECLNRMLDYLDKMMILEEILPFLTDIQCTDVDIIMAIVDIYKHLLSDKKFGLTHGLLATKVMPTLIPLTVTPGLSIEQFSSLMEVLRDMLDLIERQRLSKMVSEIPDQEDLERRGKSNELSGHSIGNKCLLGVDEKFFSKGRQPSFPELVVNSSDSGLSSSRRQSSFHGLGMAEQTIIENIVRQRRASIIAPSQQQQQLQQQQQQQLLQVMSTAGPAQPGLSSSSVGTHPHILVSEASINDFKDPSLFGGGTTIPRRPSTASFGLALVPDSSDRRDSFGRLVAPDHSPGRRSSFQGLCDSAMQFFGGK